MESAGEQRVGKAQRRCPRAATRRTVLRCHVHVREQQLDGAETELGLLRGALGHIAVGVDSQLAGQEERLAARVDDDAVRILRKRRVDARDVADGVQRPRAQQQQRLAPGGGSG